MHSTMKKALKLCITCYLSIYLSYPLHMKGMLVTHNPLRNYYELFHRTKELHSNTEFQILDLSLISSFYKREELKDLLKSETRIQDC